MSIAHGGVDGVNVHGGVDADGVNAHGGVDGANAHDDADGANARDGVGVSTVATSTVPTRAVSAVSTRDARMRRRCRRGKGEASTVRRVAATR